MKIHFAAPHVCPLIVGSVLVVLVASCAGGSQESDDGQGGVQGGTAGSGGVGTIGNNAAGASGNEQGGRGGSASSSDVKPQTAFDAAPPSGETQLRYGAPQKIGGDLPANTDNPLWSAFHQALYVRAGAMTYTLSAANKFDDIGIANVRAVMDQGAFIALRATDSSDKSVIFKQQSADEEAVDLSGVVAPPNDLVISRKGHIYFTQRKGVADAPSAEGLGLVHHVDLEKRDHKHQGVLNPNGIGLSVDEAWLYVSGSSYDKESDGGLWRFPIDSDGGLGTPSRIAQFERPDGLCVDSTGNIHVTSVTKKKVFIFSTDGQSRGEVGNLPGSLTNCAVHGAGAEQILYLTAQKSVYRLLRAQ